MSIALRGLEEGAVRERAELALAWAKHYAIPVTITSVTRTWAEQTRLYERYQDCLRRGEKVWPGNRNQACRYPANRPGDSAHNFGLAWDSWVAEPYWPAWTALRRYAGFQCPDHDRVHAEVPGWRDLTKHLRRG